MKYLYILKDRKPVAIDDVVEWAMWMVMNNGHVAHDTFDGVVVSTIFFGIDMRFLERTPVVFETMVFTGIEGGGDIRRYATWEQAEAGHAEVVAMMRRKLIESKATGIKVLDTVINDMKEGK